MHYDRRDDLAADAATRFDGEVARVSGATGRRPGQPRVTAIVLNFRRPHDTHRCLESLLRQSYRSSSIIVLNYDPADGSGSALRSAWPDVHVVDLGENRGYAGNNNLGLRHALTQAPDWLLLLNEDTVLDRGCLDELVRVAAADPNIGMLGPLILHRESPERIQSAGGRLGPDWLTAQLGRHERDEGQFVEPQDVDWLQGCALLVRRELVETVGVFDERYFMYMEEIDWCLRARRHGWRVVNVPRARLWHRGTWPGPPQPPPPVTYYMFRNRFLLLARNRAPLRAWLAAGALSLRSLVRWSAGPSRRALRPQRAALGRALRDALLLRWGAGPYDGSGAR